MKSINVKCWVASSRCSLHLITYIVSFLTFFIHAESVLYAQNEKPRSTIDSLNTEMKDDTSSVSNPADELGIYIVVDEFPEYPGGSEAMQEYLTQKVIYPREAIVERVEGTVIVSFIVNNNGSISKIKVIRGLHKALDKIAVDAIKGMPAWKAGKIQGKEVRTQVNLPIRFLLPED